MKEFVNKLINRELSCEQAKQKAKEILESNCELSKEERELLLNIGVFRTILVALLFSNYLPQEVKAQLK